MAFINRLNFQGCRGLEARFQEAILELNEGTRFTSYKDPQ